MNDANDGASARDNSTFPASCTKFGQIGKTVLSDLIIHLDRRFTKEFLIELEKTERGKMFSVFHALTAIDKNYKIPRLPDGPCKIDDAKAALTKRRQQLRFQHLPPPRSAAEYEYPVYTLGGEQVNDDATTVFTKVCHISGAVKDIPGALRVTKEDFQIKRANDHFKASLCNKTKTIDMAMSALFAEMLEGFTVDNLNETWLG